MTTWLIVLAMGAVTYLTRLSLIALFGRIEVPSVIQRSLRFVPAAVLSAIIFPELFSPAGVLDLSFANVRLMAGLLAVVIAWRTKRVSLTIGAGMVALWILMAML